MAANTHGTRLSPPRLKIGGPVLAGLFIIGLLLGGGLAAASLVPIDKGASLTGTIIVESKSKPVQHQKGGTIGRVHVREGADVKAGDLIASLDTAQIDEHIAALRSQSQSARRQLDLIRQEAGTMAELAGRQLAQRSRVLALERQVAEVEKEVAGFHARIALAEQEIGRAEIRAPVAGKVMSLAVRGPGEVLAPGGTIAEIVPQDERLVVEGRLSPALIDLVKPGQASKVWLAGINWREARPLAARVAWVSADSVEDKRSGLTFFVTRIELDEPRAEIAKRFTLHPGQRTEILVLTGERTLIDHILDPVMRNINRAFRT
ncbi:MAG: HlyD family efflux transporter periplasmic adaptor subunit [Hyphomicrobiaceae bacterium]